MDEPFDRALARAADGPEDGIGLDEVAATANHRWRRQRLLAGAGAVSVLLAVPVAVALAWGEPVEDEAMLTPDEHEADAPSPEEGEGADGHEADPPPEEGDGADTPDGRAEVELEAPAAGVALRRGGAAAAQHRRG